MLGGGLSARTNMRPPARGLPKRPVPMRLMIVGGCFPVQHNIAPARLYHATLRGRLATHYPGGPPEVAIVRYERFGTCLGKVRAAQAQRPAQVLLFHLRAEPLMRLAKLYYRYLDDHGRVRHSLNLPGRAPGNPERYDLLTRPRPAPAAEPPPESRLHRALRQANLHLGRWVGNRRRALRHYETLVTEVAAFCRQQGIRLVLVGPVSRPCAPAENQLSEALHGHFAALAARQQLDYLPVLGETDAAGQSLFFPNGVHVSLAGHDRIAHLLYQLLRPATPPQTPAPVLLESGAA